MEVLLSYLAFKKQPFQLEKKNSKKSNTEKTMEHREPEISQNFSDEPFWTSQDIADLTANAFGRELTLGEGAYGYKAPELSPKREGVKEFRLRK